VCAENGTAVGNDTAVGDESGTTVGAKSSTAVGTRSGMKVGAGSDTGVCDSTQKLLTRAKSEKCERPSSGRKWHGSRGWADRHTARGLSTGDDAGNGTAVGAGVGAAVGDGIDTAAGDIGAERGSSSAIGTVGDGSRGQHRHDHRRRK
jgi:hypothetical protein